MSHNPTTSHASPHAEALPRGHTSPWLLPVLALAQLMLILDITVANVALPDIVSDLALSPSATPWVITAYVLTLGGFMLVGGRASDLWGSRRVLLVGLAAFTAASAVAATAGDGTSLIAARVGQGLAAALLSPSALATLTSAYRGAARHRALSIWAALGGAGAAVGVIVGGVLTSGPGWRWIFLVNVPVGIAVIVAVAVLAPRQRATRATSNRLDVLGGVLVTASTAALIYALNKFGQGGSSTAAGTLALAIAVVGFGLLVVQQRRSTNPLIDPAVLATPRVATGALIMLAASAILVGLFFVLSFTFQRELGWSALETGLAFLPIAVGTILGAHLGARGVVAHGPRAVAPIGFIIAAVGLGIASWGIDSPATILVAVAISSIGLGVGFVTATTTALGDADPTRAGIVSGIVNTFHELGSAVGVAAMSSVLGAAAATSLLDRTGSALALAAGIAAAVALLAAVAIPRGRPQGGAPMHLH